MSRLCVLLLLIFTFASHGFAADHKIRKEGAVAFTEGPVWHPSGNVYFSDIVNNRIMRRDANGQMHTYRADSRRTNGMVFDLKGRLICCEGGGPTSGRRITRTELNGTITVLADKFDGKKLNSPNDVTIDSKGILYFSDPRYGSKAGLEQIDANGRAVEGVYRISAGGKVTRVIAHEVQRPNGLAISPDDKFLYVADNKNDGPDGKTGNRKLWKFKLQKDGTIDPASQKMLFDWGSDRGPDGMAIDEDGVLYVTAGFNHPSDNETVIKYRAAVYIISPDGKLVDSIPIPMDMITNCAFGGDDRRTLYITAGHTLWSTRVKTPGHLHWSR